MYVSRSEVLMGSPWEQSRGSRTALKQLSFSVSDPQSMCPPAGHIDVCFTDVEKPWKLFLLKVDLEHFLTSLMKSLFSVSPSSIINVPGLQT